MAHWYCRECKQTRPEEKMLTGWNGPWCPNCVLDEVTPMPVPRGAAEGQLQVLVARPGR